MTDAIPLTTGFGEVLAPETLVTVLIAAPDGTIALDPGALHGRSKIEQGLRFVATRDQVPNGERYWLIWVAVALDSHNTLIRYKGVAVSECWVDGQAKLAYKNLPESVNRMSEVLRGDVNLKPLDADTRARVRQHLISMWPELWDQSHASFREACA